MALIDKALKNLYLRFAASREPLTAIPVGAAALERRLVKVDEAAATSFSLATPAAGASLRIDKIALYSSANMKLQKSSDGGSTWVDLTGLLPSAVLDHELAPIELAADERFGVALSASATLSGYLMVSEVPA